MLNQWIKHAVAWYLCILVLQRSSEEDQLVGFYPKNPSLEKTLSWKCHLKKKQASFHDMQFRLIKQTGGNVVVVNQRKVVCRRKGLFKMSMDERPPNKLEAAWSVIVVSPLRIPTLQKWLFYASCYFEDPDPYYTVQTISNPASEGSKDSRGQKKSKTGHWWSIIQCPNLTDSHLLRWTWLSWGHVWALSGAINSLFQ